MMIEEDIVELIENYLGFDNQIIIYESLWLLGSLISIKLGRDRLTKKSLKEMKKVALGEDSSMR